MEIQASIRLFLSLSFIFIISNTYAQPYARDYFADPLGIPITLAGSFGELRPNHFHAGLDIRTHGETGLPVYAAADGWVSRISVQAFSYGNALFVSHPNGYTTVYAHLSRYSDEIQAYLRKEQYRLETFEVFLMPEQEMFPVHKGQIIGFTGNTGSSKAPHLHFEVRETITESPVNPLFFLRNLVQDNISPRIKGIKIYALDTGSVVKITFRGGRSLIAGYGESVLAPAGGGGKGNYGLAGLFRIEAKGTIGFSISTIDYMADFNNFIAPYSIFLSIDGKERFFQSMDKIQFAKLRYINAHADYAEWLGSKRWFERSYQLPNDSLKIYTGDKSAGRIKMDKDIMEVIYKVKDLNDSTATLPFVIHRNENLIAPKSKPAKNAEPDSLILYAKDNLIKKDEFFLHLPVGALYDNMRFNWKTMPAPPRAWSKIYKLDDLFSPLHMGCEIGIKVPDLPEKLHTKACIISDMRGPLPATYKDGYVVALTQTMGSFYVVTDTNEPSIRPLNIMDNAHMEGKTGIYIKIGDGLSGIKSFKGMVDGKWTLFEYDPREALIYHTFVPGEFGPGRHELILSVSDQVGNINTVSYHFYR